MNDGQDISRWWREPFAACLGSIEDNALQSLLTTTPCSRVLHIGPRPIAVFEIRPAVHYQYIQPVITDDLSQIGDCYFDVVILSHILEFSLDPERFLFSLSLRMRSCAYLVIVGFNPYGFLGLMRRLHRMRLRRQASLSYPFSGKFMPVSRLLSFLRRLGFQSLYGRYIGYHWPIAVQCSAHFLDAAGDRWWPGLSSAYVLTCQLGRRVPFPTRVCCHHSDLERLGASL